MSISSLERKRRKWKAAATFKAKNPTYYKEYRKRRIEEHYSIILLAKNVPCKDCGNSFPPECMDFDHLPGTIKHNGVGAMVLSSKEKLLAEIAKCEVVCSNCHRIRTYRRRRGTL